MILESFRKGMKGGSFLRNSIGAGKGIPPFENSVFSPSHTACHPSYFFFFAWRGSRGSFGFSFEMGSKKGTKDWNHVHTMCCHLSFFLFSAPLSLSLSFPLPPSLTQTRLASSPSPHISSFALSNRCKWRIPPSRSATRNGSRSTRSTIPLSSGAAGAGTSHPQSQRSKFLSASPVGRRRR